MYTSGSSKTTVAPVGVRARKPHGLQPHLQAVTHSGDLGDEVPIPYF